MPVILSTGGGSLYDVTYCLAAWSHVPSWGSILDLMFLPGGMSLSREEGGGRETPRFRKAGGTHLTGMLSCLLFTFNLYDIIYRTSEHSVLKHYSKSRVIKLFFRITDRIFSISMKKYARTT